MSRRVIGETVLSADGVRQGSSGVAERINSHFSSAVVITVVPGGILVTADLVRQLTFDIAMDFISCPHSPGERDNASPIVYQQNIPIAGRDVIVVDDAIESGGTMKRLVAHLEAFEPATFSVVTLFVKPRSRRHTGSPVLRPRDGHRRDARRLRTALAGPAAQPALRGEGEHGCCLGRGVVPGELEPAAPAGTDGRNMIGDHHRVRHPGRPRGGTHQEAHSGASEPTTSGS